MPTRKTVETSYGAVDEKTLERMQNRFDTRRLLDAMDTIDLIRCRIDGLRQDLLDLHSMAANVINEEHGSSRVVREEPIWELAEMISSDICEFTERLEQVYQTAEEVEKLAPRDDWDEEDEEEKEDEEEGEDAGRGGW
jgi:hypothetical protein